MYFIIFWVILIFAVTLGLKHRGVHEGQMLATGLGILGTFIGIVYGLWYFDVNNIDKAVPVLLSGLKFAFITSIVGMGWSLLIGIFPKELKFEGVQTENKDKSESELLSEVLEEMKKMNDNIAGDNETTLITQIQKLRTITVDKQDELKKAFDEFAKQMAENNVKSLVEAVNKVMEDFNTKINDQLGENFKQLNQGVENLLKWQDQYKQQIADSTTALQESNKSLGVSVESMGTFTDRAQEFDRTAAQLKESLETMGSSMSGLKDLADVLENSGQKIRDEISEITHGATDEMQKTMNKTLADFGSSLASISGRMADDFERIQQMLENATSK